MGIVNINKYLYIHLIEGDLLEVESYYYGC